MRTSLKVLSAIFILIVVCSVTGVYAVWNYENEPQWASTEGTVVPTLTMQRPTELPDDEEDDEKGTNHWVLVDTLVNGEGIGLNTPGSTLNQNMEKRLNDGRDYLGSMATWVTEGSNLKNIFGTKSAGLEFIIEANYDENGKLYYEIYTTDVVLSSKAFWGLAGDPNIPYGEKISPVYKTIVQNDGTEDAPNWVIKDSSVGYATSARYGALFDGALAPSFDVDTWTEITETNPAPGTTSNDPQWTYAGRVNTASVENDTTAVYYAFQPTTSGTYVLCTPPDADYSISISPSVSINADGTFTASNSREYLITLRGATEMTFCIEGGAWGTAGAMKTNALVDIYLPSSETVIYSRVTSAEAGKYTVETDEENCTVKVHRITTNWYGAENGIQEITTTVNGNGNVVWEADADTAYIITISGVLDGEMSYKVVSPSMATETSTAE